MKGLVVCLTYPQFSMRKERWCFIVGNRAFSLVVWPVVVGVGDFPGCLGLFVDRGERNEKWECHIAKTLPHSLNVSIQISRGGSLSSSILLEVAAICLLEGYRRGCYLT